MMGKKTNSTAISEVVSVILVIALVLVLAIAVYVMVFGSVDQKYMKKSVYVAGSAQQTGIPSQFSGVDPYQLLTFSPKAGDPFYLTGQSTPSGTQTTLRVISPDGRNLTPDTSSLTGSIYGKQLYIYPLSTANECQYKITDVQPNNTKSLPKMVTGRYQIMLIDENVHVLANSYTADITNGVTALPRTVLTGQVTGTSYRADCSQAGGSCFPAGGCPSVYNTSPCNTTYSTFNGNSNYLTFPDDPTLRYTGDMTIAVSIQPTKTAPFTNSNATDWQQIVGKGQIVSGVENDNYQLSLLGDRLGFEWGDTSTSPPSHYNVLTAPGNITAGQWDQINVVVQNGKLAIYNNGVSQPLTYYSGNIPGYTPIATPPTVKLQSVGNDVTIGRQNGVPYTYFKGNIGAVSLYDRALSSAEIASNLCPG